jgi:tyrosine-protein kinase Etk/Wzc
VALGNNAFRLEAPLKPSAGSVQPKSILAAGQSGGLISMKYGQDDISLKVQRLNAKPGQVFTISRQPMADAIFELQHELDLSEKGKLTNVIGVTLDYSNPVQAANILNEIINQYFRYKVERKTGEASKALTLIQDQMPALKRRLDDAENRLNYFRSASGTVDISREGELMLQRSSSLLSQISALKQKKEELLRTYQEDSDVVSTLSTQIRKLQDEARQIDSRLRILPGNQQEVIRLTRDVQVNTELYTSLLNNYKQLQFAVAGDIGHVAVIDSAVPNMVPIRPNKLIWVFLFTLVGFLAGGVLTVIRRSLRKGIEDHQIIESSLDLPVLVTVPHSKSQEGQDRSLQSRKDGLHLLALREPDDLAIESLRSLRTMLYFSTQDAVNNVIMITGPAPNIGKSFISANLAAILIQAKSKVLLVDADLRRGNLHHYFGLKNRLGGLSDILMGRSDWESVVCKLQDQAEVAASDGLQGLHLIKTGILPPDPSELLMNERFSKFISNISEVYDYVLIDVPPMLAVTDASIIGAKAGTALMVAKYGQHTLDELRTCQNRFEALNVEIKGCIFNDVRPSGFGYGYNEYKYAYHYKYK